MTALSQRRPADVHIVAVLPDEVSKLHERRPLEANEVRDLPAKTLTRNNFLTMAMHQAGMSPSGVNPRDSSVAALSAGLKAMVTSPGIADMMKSRGVKDFDVGKAMKELESFSETAHTAPGRFLTADDVAAGRRSKQLGNDCVGRGDFKLALDHYHPVTAMNASSDARLPPELRAEARELQRSAFVNVALCFHRCDVFDLSAMAARKAKELATTDAHRAKAWYREAAALAEVAQQERAAQGKKAKAAARQAASDAEAAVAQAERFGLDPDSAQTVRGRIPNTE
jgi:hypothetical protein